MKMSCLSECLGMTEKEGDTASGVRSRTDTECPESWCVLHPASAHAPNNVTCSGDSGEGRPLCGQEDSDWVFGAK